MAISLINCVRHQDWAVISVGKQSVQGGFWEGEARQGGGGESGTGSISYKKKKHLHAQHGALDFKISENPEPNFLV